MQQVRAARSTATSPGGRQNVDRAGATDDPAQNQVMIRVPYVGRGVRAVAEPDEATQVVAALKKATSAQFKSRRARKSSVRRSAQELTSKGIWATVLSLVGILAYLAFRFQFSFGVGAVVATIHDLLDHARVPRVLPLRHDAERHRRRS